MTQIIVLGGYATAGKDAMADILVSELGWYKTYMSKPLEKALLILNPWCAMGNGKRPVPYQELHAKMGYEKTKTFPEVRRLLQTLGTEIGRNLFHRDVWLNMVLEDTSTARLAQKNVVVTGVRYNNELTGFYELGARSCWVHRPGVKPVNGHSSDNSLKPKDFDLVIQNDKTLEDLKSYTINMFKDKNA